MLKVRRFVRGTDDCKINSLQGYYTLANWDKNHATVLVICKADYRKHLGQFSCTARNRLGNGTAKAFVDILGEYFILMKRKNAWVKSCAIFSKYRVSIFYGEGGGGRIINPLLPLSRTPICLYKKNFKGRTNYRCSIFYANEDEIISLFAIFTQ
jgi:hypothetical protein